MVCCKVIFFWEKIIWIRIWLDLTEFNNQILNPLEKLSPEGKNIYLMGDYNIDLMKIEVDVTTSQIFDTSLPHKHTLQ